MGSSGRLTASFPLLLVGAVPEFVAKIFGIFFRHDFHNWAGWQ